MPVIWAVLLVAGVGCLFYLVVPGLGAFQVRHGWRRFRKRIAAAARMPMLERPASAREGSWRFLGALEALQGRNRVWLSALGDGGSSVAADLEGAPIYVLPWHEGGDGEPFGDEEPQILSWKSIAALPAGTQVLVAGTLAESGGQKVFRSTVEPLLVVFYEGDARTLLQRAVWCGRQRNEYWNHLTQISLLTGFFALFMIGTLLLREPQLRVAAIAAFALCVTPAVMFLPPGVACYFLYRRLWKRARTLRAERDLFRLPLGYFDQGPALDAGATALPDGERYCMLKGARAQLEEHLAPGASPETWDSALTGSVRQGATLFGAADQDTGRVRVPRDPMAGLILLPGDPEKLARRAAAVARRNELLAGSLFLLGFLPNVALVLYALRRIVW
jgi:hypothetical protein